MRVVDVDRHRRDGQITRKMIAGRLNKEHSLCRRKRVIQLELVGRLRLRGAGSDVDDRLVCGHERNLGVIFEENDFVSLTIRVKAVAEVDSVNVHEDIRSALKDFELPCLPSVSCLLHQICSQILGGNTPTELARSGPVRIEPQISGALKVGRTAKSGSIQTCWTD